jgi:hypothetical protein
MLKRLLGVAKGPRTRRCSFTLDAPDAQAVALAGSFNGWAPDARPLKRGKGGAWETTFLLPPGRYEYRFVVDGQWRDDPACTERVPNGHGSENCVRHVAAAVTGKPIPAKELDRYRDALTALAASGGAAVEAEVTAALGRIDAGTFGTCAECGKRIAKARLVAVPYARRCARCAPVAQSIAG